MINTILAVVRQQQWMEWRDTAITVLIGATAHYVEKTEFWNTAVGRQPKVNTMHANEPYYHIDMVLT